MTSSLLTRFRPFPVAGLLLALVSPIQALPVFPGAAGFGSETTAARNSTAAVIKVTTLADTGAGSLRAALLTTGPRYIIFEVSGIIRLASAITLNPQHSFVTVAGQTAPAPGIIVEGNTINVVAHDVLIQHIALRPGKKLHLGTGVISTDPYRQNPGYEMARRDAIVVNARSDDTSTTTNEKADVYNVVLDHVSHSWSADEIASTWGNGTWGAATTGRVYDVTFSNCIFSEALYNAGHTTVDDGSGTPEPHSMGVLIGRNTRRVSLLRNLMAFNEQRNPLLRDDHTEVLIVNNMVYHPGSWVGHRIQVGDRGSANVPQLVSIKHNVVVMSPGSTEGRGIYVHSNHPSSTGVYLVGNESNIAGQSTWNPTTSDQWHSSLTSAPTTVTKLTSEPSLFTSSTLNLPAPVTGRANIESHVLANAGARPAARDVVDARVVSQVTARSSGSTGGFIDSPAQRIVTGTFTSGELAGYPAWTQLNVTRTPPASPNADSDADGYSDIEEWIHGQASIVEGAAASTTLDTKISSFDTFADGNAAGWSPLGYGHWAVTGGVYRQNGDVEGARALLAGTNWNTHVVQARVKPLSFNGTGRFLALYARHHDWNNSYYVSMRGSPDNRIEIRKVVNGVASTIGGVYALTPAIGTWYTLRLEVSGTTTVNLKAYLNGAASPILDVTDNAPPAQLASGAAAIGGYFSTAEFDDVFASPFLTDRPQLVSDFHGGSTTGWTPAVGTWSAASGVYTHTDEAAVTGRVTGGTAASAQSIQADVRLNAVGDSTRWGGVYARYANVDNCYYLLLRASGALELKKLLAGGQTIYQTYAAGTIPTGQWNTLRLEVSGTNPVTLKGYLNGVLRVQGSDSAPLPSAGAALGTNYADVSFDDVTYTVP